MDDVVHEQKRYMVRVPLQMLHLYIRRCFCPKDTKRTADKRKLFICRPAVRFCSRIGHSRQEILTGNLYKLKDFLLQAHTVQKISKLFFFHRTCPRLAD